MQNMKRDILRIALPAIFSLFSGIAFNIINIFWISLLGNKPLTAVSATTIIIWGLETIIFSVSTGMIAIITRRLGEKNTQEANYVGMQGIQIGIVFSIIVAVSIYFLQNTLFSIMGTPQEINIIGRQYLSIYLLGVVFLYIYMTAEAVFKSFGDTKTVMFVTLSALVINAILDPFLILGISFFPRLGVSGAAIATVFSEALAAIVFIIILYQRKWIINFNFKIDIPLTLKIFKIGFPTSFSGLVFCMVYLFLIRNASHFGTAAVAALGIGPRVEGFSWMICVGFSIAASTLVGQSLGENDSKKAKKYSLKCLLYTTILTGGFMILFFLFAPYIVSIFSSDNEIIKAGTMYLRIIAISQIFMGVEYIVSGVFSGAGYTFPIMIISIPLTVMRIPLAYLFSIILNWGIPGIWIAIAISSISKGTIFFITYLKGNWQKTKI